MLSVDGKGVVRNTMEHSTPINSAEDGTFDVGSDTRTGVAMIECRHESPFEFTGTIDQLTFNLAPHAAPAAP